MIETTTYVRGCLFEYKACIRTGQDVGLHSKEDFPDDVDKGWIRVWEDVRLNDVLIIYRRKVQSTKPNKKLSDCIERARWRSAWMYEMANRIREQRGHKRCLAQLHKLDKDTRLQVAVKGEKIIVTYKASTNKEKLWGIPTHYKYFSHKVIVVFPNGQKKVIKDQTGKVDRIKK
jgi:hypothetical protein